MTTERSMRALALSLIVFGVVAIATPALAGNVGKLRPFNGAYEGSPAVPTTVTCVVGIPQAAGGTGQANHLGSFTWHAEFCLEFTGVDTVAVNVGFTEIVAANGDELHNTWTTTGTVGADGTLSFVQQFSYSGGTGRFERAIGSATAVGTQTGDGSSTASWAGELAFDASDRGEG